MDIKELIRLKRRAKIKMVIFTILIPSPGLVAEAVAQIEYYNRQIEQIALEQQQKPAVVCPINNSETK